MKKTAALFALALAFPAYGQQDPFARQSAWASGTWHAMSVPESGMYRISYAQLAEMGLDPASLDPNRLHVYGFGGGPLPQANQAPRPADIPQLPVWVLDGGDGRLDPGDALLFYAQGPHRRWADEPRGLLLHEQNPYADRAQYFLCVSDAPPLRLETAPAPPSAPAPFRHFDDMAYFEPEATNVLSSGREWFSKAYSVTLQEAFRFDLPGLLPNTLRLTAQVLARSAQPMTFAWQAQGQPLAEQTVRGAAISTYGPWGTLDSAQWTAANTAQTPFDVAFSLQKAQASDVGYLDFVRVQAQRELALYGSQTAFRVLESAALPAAAYRLANLPAAGMVWDLSDPQRPLAVALERNGQEAVFRAAPEGRAKEYIAFDPTASLPAPTWEGFCPNQNLHALDGTDLLLIAAPELLPEAERLADFRRTHDGLRVTVVSSTAVFREFSSGLPDPTAIRDFVRMLYRRGGLRYLLLFGEASYDYWGRNYSTKNQIPVYQSINSIHPLLTYSSDDYFGFLDEGEGTWAEGGAGLNTHLLDVGVGRLPAGTLEEARVMVDKLLAYATDPEAGGPWRQRLVFAADDGDLNLHQLDADSLARMALRQEPAYDARRIFIDDFPQETIGGVKRAPEARAALMEAVEEGALVVNFTGHGSETGWTSEGLFDNPAVLRLRNGAKMPLFVTATCEFGRYDDPSRHSGAELLLLQPGGGAIGLVTTTRPVLSFSNFRANKAFYETLFLPENGEMPRLGDVMRRTKNNSLNGVNNRNFSLLGDPSMRLAYPQRRLRFTEWQGRPWTDADTASALMPLSIAGEVLDEAGQRDASFEGWAEVALYDRPARRQTRGDDDENVPMAYEAFDDVLFRGVVPVAAGRFEVRLVVPKDASYGYGQGKVTAYTQASAGLPDAQGFGWMRVGGTAGSPEADTQGPQLRAWLESRAFEPGDVVPRQPLLLLEAEDASGFNLSGKGVGRDWEAVVDDEETWRYALQSRLRLDTGRFDRGQLAFLLPHPLPPGKHTLRLRGYDAYNNLTELLLEFAVAGGVQAQWQALWPNPTAAGVQWALSHNRAGDDLALDWEICDVQGRTVWQHRETAYASDPVLRRAWNGTDAQGRPLRPGLYVLRVRLQSLADGQETQAVRRLSVLR